jgi:hypothetical protein
MVSNRVNDVSRYRLTIAAPSSLGRGMLAAIVVDLQIAIFAGAGGWFSVCLCIGEFLPFGGAATKSWKGSTEGKLVYTLRYQYATVEIPGQGYRVHVLTRG